MCTERRKAKCSTRNIGIMRNNGVGHVCRFRPQKIFNPYLLSQIMTFSDNPSCPDLKDVKKALASGAPYQVQFGVRVQDQIDIIKIVKSKIVVKKTVDYQTYFEGLNKLCQKYGAKLNIRFYGHYSDVFDGKILEHLPDVSNLIINCLHEAENLEPLSGLGKLEEFSMGIYELKQKDILDVLPLENLKFLALEETQTKALDLSFLPRAQKLETLKLYGHKKNIQAVGELASLEEFVFNPARNMDLEFLSKLPKLRSLKLVLGGMDDFNDLSLAQLEQLAVTQVRGLTSLGDLSRFPKLRQLLVQEQKQIDSLAFSKGSKHLEDLMIGPCRNLTDLPGLAELPVLKNLSIGETAVNFDQLVLPKSVTNMMFVDGTSSGNKAAQEKIRARGLISKMPEHLPFFYK